MTGELQWAQVSFLRRDLQLMRDGAVIATARVVPKCGLIVESSDGQLTVRSGGIDPRASSLERAFAISIGWGTTVVDQTNRVLLGQAHRPWFFDKTVMLADGAKYVWLSNFISTQHVWVTDGSREPVMAFQQGHFMIRSKGSIGVMRELDKQHERCLIALGWWWVAGIQ